MGVKISQLPAVSSLTGTEIFPVVQGGITSEASINQIPYTPPGTGAVTSTVQAKLQESVSVLDFYANGVSGVAVDPTGVVDSTLGIQAAINAMATIGGVVFIPPGQYKTTAPIVMASGVSLCGAGNYIGISATREAVSSIYAQHTGVAVISLKGCIGCKISDLGIITDAGAVPKTGLLLGRSSASSAGYHKFESISVYGYYSLAAIYSIASEDNIWLDINVWVFGGGAKYCLYTGISDSLLTGAGLTTSSNLENKWYAPFFINSSTDANSACIFIQGAQAVGSWSFIGGYLTAYAGSYIQIDSGTIDALDCIGPFTFLGMSGELLQGGDPIYGVRLTSTGTRTLPGLTVLGMRLAFLAGTNHYQIIQPGNLILESPNIHIKPPEAFPYALCSLQRTQIKNGSVIVGRLGEPTPLTFMGDFSNYFGAPYIAASYTVDSQNVFRLQGTVNGTTGNIFTIPSDLRPAANMFFFVLANGAVGRVLITASTGVVSVSSGSGLILDLSTIQYKIA